MKISTKGRYALRLMLDLAVNNNNTYIPLKDISKRQGISDKYLEQIITQLSKAGLVKSFRGAQGGYMLSDIPENYTVGDILTVMEGSFAPVHCVECQDSQCDRKSQCVSSEVWAEIKDAVENVVYNITLKDLMNRHSKKQIN